MGAEDRTEADAAGEAVKSAGADPSPVDQAAAKPAPQVRVFRVPNKLRDKLLKSGGARAVELLAKADANLEFLRPRCLNQISDLISEIVARYGAGKRKGDEDFEGLYALSARIIDISTPVADLEIDRAAFSLCELVDRCEGVGQWDWRSVDVHIDALMLLRMDVGAMPAAARQQIFNGLQKLNKRLPTLAESQAATGTAAAPTDPPEAEASVAP